LINNAKQRQRRPKYRQNLLELLKILRREDLKSEEKSRDTVQTLFVHLVCSCEDYAEILRY
jgi:hypothetical protein